MQSILFGIISGIVSSMGMGGGTILIFLLTTFIGLEQHIAQGTNLIFFVPTSIAAILVNIKNKNIKFKTSMVIIVSGIIGAIIGASISVKLNVDELRKYFGYFLIVIAINEFYSLYKKYFKPFFKSYSKLNIKNKKANNKNI